MVKVQLKVVIFSQEIRVKQHHQLHSGMLNQVLGAYIQKPEDLLGGLHGKCEMVFV